TLVITDLARAPHIVVLEREHLQHLQTERDLTKLEQNLRASVRLLEAGIRRAGATNKLAVTVHLRPLAGGEPLLTTVTVPFGDAVAARDAIVEQIAGLLRVRRPEPSAVDRAEEARQFAQQAVRWVAWSDKPRAVRAAETAYALDPSPTNRVLLAGTLVWDPLDETRWLMPLQRYEQTTFRQAIRSGELLFDWYRTRLAACRAGSTAPAPLPFLGYISGSEFQDETSAPGLREELRQLEDRLFRAQLEYYAQCDQPGSNRYWTAWATRLGMLEFYYPDQPAKQLALIREAVKAFVTMPDLPGPFPSARLGMLSGVTAKTFNSSRRSFGRRGKAAVEWVDVPRLCKDAATQRLYRDLWRELTKHPDPFIRFVGYSGLSALHVTNEEYVAAQRALRKIVLDEIPCTHRYRQQVVLHGLTPLNDLVFFGSLEMRNLRADTWPAAARAEAMDDIAQLLRDLAGCGEPRSFDALRGMSQKHLHGLDLLADNGRLEEALKLSEEIIAALTSSPIRTASRIDFVQRRDRYRRRLTGAEAPPPPALGDNGPGWDQYDIHHLDLGLRLPQSRDFYQTRLFLMSAGDRLYCLRPVPAGAEESSRFDLSLTVHRLPDGQFLDRVDVPVRALVPFYPLDRRDRWFGGVYAAVLGDDAIYAGTCAGLVRIPLTNRRWKLFTPADGLPGTVVRALGWHDGRLYLGIGCEPYTGEGDDQAVFASYDPRTTSFQVIASEKGVEGQTPWNGQPFRLDNIEPDPDHQCLWLVNRGQGIWKFTPSTRAWEEVFPTKRYLMLPTSRFTGRFRTCPSNRSTGGGPILFRPRDRAQITLSVRFLGRSCWLQSHSVALDGDRVIGGAMLDASGIPEPDRRVLYLIQPDQPPSPLWRLPDGEPFPGALYLHRSAAGIIAVSEDGASYLIVRKDGQPQ
ncbi:hypothetical protein HQ590_03395, partial [bacterium]|nr:hypothetical protein [bacterium]